MLLLVLFLLVVNFDTIISFSPFDLKGIYLTILGTRNVTVWGRQTAAAGMEVKRWKRIDIDIEEARRLKINRHLLPSSSRCSWRYRAAAGNASQNIFECRPRPLSPIYCSLLAFLLTTRWNKDFTAATLESSMRQFVGMHIIFLVQMRGI